MDFQKHKLNTQQKNGNGSMDGDKISTENHLDKEIKFEYDSIHLKDHLNASFDKDNIVVSEELIQKTLQAIQSGKDSLTPEEDNQEANTSTERKKKNRFPIFRLAGIAAVLLLLLIGLNILKYLPGSSKSMENETNSSVEDTSDSSSLKRQENGTLERNTEAQKDKEIYSITAGEAEADQKVAKDGKDALSDEGADKFNLETEPQEAKMGISSAGTMIFSDILPFTAEQVSSFSIINSKKESTAFREPEKIDDFLLMLNEYSLLPAEQEEDTSESQGEDLWDYQIVFTTQDNLTYTILVGNEIQLKTDDNNRDIIRYTIIGDVEQLKSRLNEYR